jgi:hypothetical protein
MFTELRSDHALSALNKIYIDKALKEPYGATQRFHSLGIEPFVFGGIVCPDARVALGNQRIPAFVSLSPNHLNREELYGLGG